MLEVLSQTKLIGKRSKQNTLQKRAEVKFRRLGTVAFPSPFTSPSLPSLLPIPPSLDHGTVSDLMLLLKEDLRVLSQGRLTRAVSVSTKELLRLPLLIVDLIIPHFK